MKLKHLILFLAVVVAACSTRHPVETRQGTSLPNNMVCQQLQAIDSLMWQQPDSALMVLVDFAASPKADSLSTFDGHYFQILLSELLFKNDCEQTNRAELLEAVDYFDSLTTVLSDTLQPRSRHCGPSPQSPGHYDNLVFLDARAHYINGVGYYERDNVVEACTEYLKALEVMEGQFEEKELVKNKAKFKAYTYNRLGDMFSGQFMMEAAITCYENALAYCRIETTSPTGVSNTLTRMGLQYEQLKDTEKMRMCYSQALEEMPDSDNLSYRDLAASKALCDYKADSNAEQSLETLRHILSQAEDEDERLTRYLSIGVIFSHEEMYDSAVAYLESVFENTRDEVSQIQAAEHLHNIYESLGNEARSNECIRFLANHKVSASENKAMVSQLDNLFQDYLKQKQEKLSEAEHAKHIRKIVGIIVPIAVLLAMAIIIVAKLRSRKLLKQQQEKSDRVLGETEQAHEEELRRLQAETQQRLEEADERHKEEMEKMRQLAIQKQKANVSALLEEQVCQQIICGIKVNNIKRSTKPKDYPELILDETQKIELSVAVEKHCNGFEDKLLRVYPQITSNDLNLCRLFLLGLEEKHAAVLLNRDYSAIRRQSLKLKEAFGTDKEVPFFLKELILNN